MNFINNARAAAQVAKYRALKDTPEFQQAQAAERAETIKFIEGLGYTRERATRAAEDYADAASETRRGPDWEGFRELVEQVGLA